MVAFLPYNLLLLLLPLLFLTPPVHANTEIINLSATSPSPSAIEVSDSINENTQSLWSSMPFVLRRPLLHAKEPELIFSLGAVSPTRARAVVEDPESVELCTNSTLGYGVLGPAACIHGAWVRLDMTGEGWGGYERFTLRASWAASYPIDVHMELFDITHQSSSSSSAADATITPIPRQKLARIRLTDTAILPSSSSSLYPYSSPEQSEMDLVPLILILEPLYLGVIPASVVPIIFALVGVMLLSAWAVKPIYGYLEGVAARSREGAGKKKQ